MIERWFVSPETLARVEAERNASLALAEQYGQTAMRWYDAKEAAEAERDAALAPAADEAGRLAELSAKASPPGQLFSLNLRDWEFAVACAQGFRAGRLVPATPTPPAPSRDAVEAMRAAEAELSSIHGLHGDQTNAEEHSVALKLLRAALAPAETSQEDRIEKLEDVLRGLASYLGTGGYNADTVDPDVFDRKIRDGIEMLAAPFVKDAARYRKLRGIGAAPGGTLHLEEGLVMVATNLDAWLDEYLTRGIPPAPSVAVEFKGHMPAPRQAPAETSQGVEAKLRKRMNEMLSAFEKYASGLVGSEYALGYRDAFEHIGRGLAALSQSTDEGR